MSTRNFFVTDARMMMADSDNRSYPLDGAALVLDDDRDNRRIREELSARRLVEICQRMENEIYVTKDKFPEIEMWLKSHSEEEIKQAARQIDVNSGKYPLHYIVECSHSEEVIKLVQDAYPDAVFKKDTTKGSLPLHYLVRGGCNVRQFDLVFHANPSAVRMTNDKDLLPLHYACHYNCGYDIIKRLIDVYPEGIKMVAFDNSTPLHMAARGGCSLRVIKLLFDAYPEAAGHKDSIRDYTPFENGSSDLFPKFLNYYLQQTIGSKRLQRLNFEKCRTHVQPLDIFRDGLINNSHLSVCLDHLNKMSCKRDLVFFLMMELYLHLLQIWFFIHASDLYIQNSNNAVDFGAGSDNEKFTIIIKRSSIGLITVASMFLLIEMSQLFTNFRGNVNFSDYVMNLWNWIELTAVSLAMASGILMLIKDPTNDSGDYNDLSEPTQRLFMSTGVFILMFFISYLKKTLFPFARFVTGVVAVFFVLFPYAVISTITLFGFAYLYYVQFNAVVYDLDKKENFESLEKAFYTVFDIFVGVPYTIEHPLDILLAIIVILVLLNVVIAIVSEAWQNSAKEARRAFWDFRVTADQDIAPVIECSEFFSSWTLTYLKSYIKWELPRKPVLALFTFLKLGIFVVLGFFSFGVCWPMFFRELLFTDLSAAGASESIEDHTLQDQVDELKKQVADLANTNKEQMNEIQKQVALVLELVSRQAPAKEKESTKLKDTVEEEKFYDC